MISESQSMSGIFIKQKIALIFFGLFLFMVLLETSLRLAGFILLSLQEHRNSVSLRQKGAYRILCLGESTTVGGEEAYPAQLEKVLNQRYPEIKFSVINKGVSGVNSTSILKQLEGNLKRYHPAMVITMFGVNDKFTYGDYQDTWNAEPEHFFTNFRIYKLIKLLWLHIINKAQELDIYKIKEPLKNKPDGLTPKNKIDERERFYLGDRDYIQAEEFLKKKIAQQPDDFLSYLRLGWCYRRQNKLIQAEEALEKAAILNPQSFWAQIELGRCYRLTGKHAQAEKAFKKAIELSQDSPLRYWPYLELGRCYRGQGKLIQAEEALRTAIHMRPDNAKAYVELGDCYRQQGKFIQAEEAFKRTIALNPNFDIAYAHLAFFYAQQGKKELANKYFKIAEALRLKTYNPVTCKNYNRLKKIVTKKGLRLVCMQYPMVSLEPLKMMFDSTEGIIFVDNENIFKEAVRKSNYSDYFKDNFAGDFGHCTLKGNRLLAEHIADVLSKECFQKPS